MRVMNNMCDMNDQIYHDENVLDKEPSDVENNCNKMINAENILHNNELIELSKNCDTIVLGQLFNFDLSIIPPNIVNIIYDDNVESYPPVLNLHSYVKKIKFGNKFNQSIDDLPSSLEQIEFGPDSIFNKSIDNLPCTIKKIKFGKYFNIPINNLPQNLEYLDIQSDFFTQELKNIPKGLKFLYFNCNLSYFYEKEIKNLPNGLEEICYPPYYNFKIYDLPESVKIVRLYYNYEFLDEIKLFYPNKKIILY
jgi:hypothetical protein